MTKSPSNTIPHVTSTMNAFEKFDLALWKNWEVFRGLVQQNLICFCGRNLKAGITSELHVKLKKKKLRKTPSYIN